MKKAATEDSAPPLFNSGRELRHANDFLRRSEGSSEAVANADGGAPFLIDDAAGRAFDVGPDTGSTSTACGYGQSAMGPFYCPADRKVYLDLSFYNDMQKKLGGGGDFALGYVLAHEVGHHVQTVLGISEQVQTLQQRVTKKEANALQVKMELQADCFAGVWGHFMEKRGILEAGDLEEALKTATAIGDDRLQKEATGRVVPDSFTHGTSLQRLNWFKKGFRSGNPNVCNTWQADKL